MIAFDESQLDLNNKKRNDEDLNQFLIALEITNN